MKSHAPVIKISDLNAQLESIKDKNRRYNKRDNTQLCYDENNESSSAAHLRGQPRAFRLGEEEFENSG